MQRRLFRVLEVLDDGNGREWALPMPEHSAQMLQTVMMANNSMHVHRGDRAGQEAIIEIRLAIDPVLNHLTPAYVSTPSTGMAAYTIAACTIAHRRFVDSRSIAVFMEVFSDQEKVIRTLRCKTYSLSRAVESLDAVVPRWMQPRTRLRPVRSAHYGNFGLRNKHFKRQKFQDIEAPSTDLVQ